MGKLTPTCHGSRTPSSLRAATTSTLMRPKRGRGASFGSATSYSASSFLSKSGILRHVTISFASDSLRTAFSYASLPFFLSSSRALSGTGISSVMITVMVPSARPAMVSGSVISFGMPGTRFSTSISARPMQSSLRFWRKRTKSESQHSRRSFWFDTSSTQKRNSSSNHGLRSLRTMRVLYSAPARKSLMYGSHMPFMSLAGSASHLTTLTWSWWCWITSMPTSPRPLSRNDQISWRLPGFTALSGICTAPMPSLPTTSWS
mmetsp:Transcript_11684/g.36295  ORF Transcript_11684/g.36295 Transcript_11684/m.36295 type:complete len:261 (+) Transcript_11684:1056-1838(+)